MQKRFDLLNCFSLDHYISCIHAGVVGMLRQCSMLFKWRGGTCSSKCGKDIRCLQRLLSENKETFLNILDVVFELSCLGDCCRQHIILAQGSRIHISSGIAGTSVIPPACPVYVLRRIAIASDLQFYLGSMRTCAVLGKYRNFKGSGRLVIGIRQEICFHRHSFSIEPIGNIYIYIYIHCYFQGVILTPPRELKLLPRGQ